MPLYDYTCAKCGDFEAWRTMAEVSQSMDCPTCNDTAIRLLVAPNISLNGGSLKSRLGSSAEPRLVKRQEKIPSTPKNQGQQGGRPWMLGHSRERL